MIACHGTRSSLFHSLPAAITLLKFSHFHHKFFVTDLCGCRGLTGLMKTEQHCLHLQTFELCVCLVPPLQVLKGICWFCVALFKKNGLLNEDGNFEPLHLSLWKNNIAYSSLWRFSLYEGSSQEISTFSCIATDLLNTVIYILLICYVWPSVCGWNTVGIFHFLLTLHKKLSKILYFFFLLINTLCSFHPVREMLYNDNPRYSNYPHWSIICGFL